MEADVHLVIADEGRGPFAADANTIKGHSTLSELQGTGRSAGVSFYVLTNALSLTDRGLRSNVFLTAAFRPANGEDGRLLQRTMDLTDEQTAYLQRMPRGEAIVKLGGAPAFLTTFQPLPDTYDHVVYEQARSRTRAILLARARRTVAGLTPTTPEPGTAPAPVTREIALNATCGQAVAGLTPTTPEPESAPAPPPVTPRVALNTHAQSILTDAAAHGIVTTSECFTRCGIHPQAGMRGKKQLLDLSLIEEERITIRRGRGGTAVAIRPTARGYARAGVKRRSTRGGDSVQHEWLVRRLASNIRSAKIDALVGRKACDILISYNETHAALAAFCGITPKQGALIAIEVEVSDPTRTAPKNVASNAEAGVAHTIIASTTPLHCKGAIVIDVFALLEAL
jgi:hypothetical protein